MANSGGADHDSRYHRLFSHPGVVAQLLRGFVDPALLVGLDLTEMESLSATFYPEAGARRQGDTIWRIPRRDGGEAYLVLLLEFQSTVERFMAVRVLTYAGLLWQKLIDEQRLGARDRLPPLLSVVVYNGDASWHAPAAARELVALPAGSPLWPWQPDLRYHLIATGAFSDAELRAREGLPALWFRLENATVAGEMFAAADALIGWLNQNPAFGGTRAVFAELLSALLAPLGPAARMPEELMEVRSMLATRLEKWAEQWRQEGRDEALEAGRAAGRQEGERAGETRLLLRLLERRFGALPAWVADRVSAADIADLDDWGLRVLDAQRLDDVFDGPPAGRAGGEA